MAEQLQRKGTSESLKSLFVFDDLFEINSKCVPRGSHSAALFPLTSDPRILDEIIRSIRARGMEVALINSARAVNHEVEHLRGRLHSWSAGISEMRVWKKSVKEWLSLPGHQASTWWFSFFSEKNPFKTTAFLKMAQVRAVEEVLTSGLYEVLFVAVSDRTLRSCLCRVAEQNNKTVLRLPVRRKYTSGMASKGKWFLNNTGLMGEISKGVYTLFKVLIEGYLARRYMKPAGARHPESGATMFVSYFPAVESDSAEQGVFRNRYALPLQTKLREWKCEVAWILMIVPLYGYHFRQALSLAARFAEKGEKLIIFQEFFRLRHFFRGLFLWMRQILISFFLYRCLENKLTAEPLGYGCGPVVRKLWQSSFYGSAAVEGILHFLIFLELFKHLPHCSRCIYVCEMHAWEKALNAGKQEALPRLRTIGFQHTSISKNYFHYFHDKSEMLRNGRPYSLPLPDILACNGGAAQSLFAEAGYGNVVNVEAVRYFHLRKFISSFPGAKVGRPVLLVVGSIDRNEMLSLIKLIGASFPKPEHSEIWFKNHPALPLESIFTAAGIDPRAYVLPGDELSECLRKARAVLVPTSTASIEALAFGCEVIIPMLADSILMNPLADYDGYCHKITNAEELKFITYKIFSGYSLSDRTGYGRFIESYWNLNPDMPNWRNLLMSDSSGHFIE